ncbi:hypothetical protein SNE40_008417 [Patella caerulea]|uniref:Uncharacterized protein n=1 Tax=Patella caerulea TaxID=87958 RepID=A0AAN8K025_PATCE
MPGRPGLEANKINIHVLRRGEGSHVLAIIIEEPTKQPTAFSPEVIRPHQIASSRKTNSKGKKRRKSAILTDTPEKEALEKEQKDRLEKQNKTKKAKVAKRKIKNSKKRLEFDYSSNNTESCCLVC